MDIFDAYDEEFKSLAANVRTKIGELDDIESASSPMHTDCAKSIRIVEGLLGQVNELIKQMELEARSSDDPATKRAASSKVQGYRDDLGSLQVGRAFFLLRAVFSAPLCRFSRPTPRSRPPRTAPREGVRCRAHVVLCFALVGV